MFPHRLRAVNWANSSWPQGPLANKDATPLSSGGGVGFQLSLYFLWNGYLTVVVERETCTHQEKLLRALHGLLLSGVLLICCCLMLFFFF